MVIEISVCLHIFRMFITSGPSGEILWFQKTMAYSEKEKDIPFEIFLCRNVVKDLHSYFLIVKDWEFNAKIQIKLWSFYLSRNYAILPLIPAMISNVMWAFCYCHSVMETLLEWNYLGTKTIIHDLAISDSYGLQAIAVYLLLVNTIFILPNDVLENFSQVIGGYFGFSENGTLLKVWVLLVATGWPKESSFFQFKYWS